MRNNARLRVSFVVSLMGKRKSRMQTRRINNFFPFADDERDLALARVVNLKRPELRHHERRRNINYRPTDVVKRRLLRKRSSRRLIVTDHHDRLFEYLSKVSR